MCGAPTDGTNRPAGMISASCPAISYSKTDGLPSSVHLLQSSLRFSRRVTVRLFDVKPYAPKAQWSAAVSIDERIKAFTEVLKIVAWPAIIVWLAWYFRVEVKRVAIGLKFAPKQVPTQPTTGVSAAVPPGPASTPSGQSVAVCVSSGDLGRRPLVGSLLGQNARKRLLLGAR
jgi:hypothetical protein